MKVVLVELPFMSVYRPSLALTSLEQSLACGGHSCEVWYENLVFARAIGRERYDRLVDSVPYWWLTVDRIFARTLFGSQREATAAIDSVGEKDYLPDWLQQEISDLAGIAFEFSRELSSRLLAADAGLVGFSLDFFLTPALGVAKQIRASPTAPWILFGGGNCEGEMGMELMAKFPWVDFACQGEGEQLIVDLADRLERSKANPQGRQSEWSPHDELLAIPGLLWRSEHRLEANERNAPPSAGLDHLPMPRYEPWIDQVLSSGLGLDRSELSILFEGSRGCWYGQKHHCTFCGLNGPSLLFRSKSPDRLAGELGELAGLGIPSAEATDLIMDHRYFDEFLPLLAERKLGMSIYFETKSNLTEDNLRVMRRAGVDRIQPGIESLSSELLKLMRKGVRAYQNLRLLRMCAEFGIYVDWSMLYGFPNEQAEWFDSIAQLVPRIAHLQPPTGGCARVILNRFSPLFEEHASYGIQSVAPVKGYNWVFPDGMVQLERVAYFFDGERPAGSGVEDAQRRMIHAVTAWQGEMGSHVLLSIPSQDGLSIVESHALGDVRVQHLQGSDLSVYLACRDGVQADIVVKRLNLNAQVVAKCLAKLERDRLVAELDDRWVALPVAFPAMPDGVGPVAAEAATYLYRLRARASWATPE